MYVLAYWTEARTRPYRQRRLLRMIAAGGMVERTIRARLSEPSGDRKPGPARLLITKSGIELELGRRRPGQIHELTMLLPDTRAVGWRETLSTNPRALVGRCQCGDDFFDVTMLPEDVQLVRTVLGRMPDPNRNRNDVTEAKDTPR